MLRNCPHRSVASPFQAAMRPSTKEASPEIGMLPEATGRDSGRAPAPFGGSSVRTS